MPGSSPFQADAEAAQKEATRLGAERNAEAEKAQKDGARLRRMEEQLQVQWVCLMHRMQEILLAVARACCRAPTLCLP